MSSWIDREPVEHVTDELLWDAECAGKDRYPSEAAAEADLKRIKAEGRLHKACWLETYACSSCKQWHIGNSRRVTK